MSVARPPGAGLPMDPTTPVHALMVVESATDAAPELARVAAQALHSSEPVFLHLDPETLDEVLTALAVSGAAPATRPDAPDAPASPLLSTGTPPDLSSPPAAVLDDSLRRVQQLVDRGAWTLTCEPSVSDRVWHEWLRVEAAVNVLLPQPRRLCVYERHQVGDRRLEALEALHPQLLQDGEWAASAAYRAPEEGPGWPLFQDPLDLPSPAVHLVGPSPAELRAAIREAAAPLSVDADQVDALAFAATEVLSNAHQHGARPIGAGVWPSEAGLTVGVSDAGAGPQDLLLGLRRSSSQEPADGMWAVHRLVDVHHTRDGTALRGGLPTQARAEQDGYTVYLSVGHPRSPE